MKVCINDKGDIQCLSDTCTSYCPKFEDCKNINTTMGNLIRELATEDVSKHQNGG